ncbi:5565_t:CDS:2, partial [Scutellospora calospora]
KDVPELFVKLMRNCWDANPRNRPKADKLFKILDDWYWKLYDKSETPESLAFMASDNNMPQPDMIASSRPVTQTHPLASYTSRSFNFQNLPTPKNSPSINYRSNSTSYSSVTRGISYRTVLNNDENNECSRQLDKATILEPGSTKSETYEISSIDISATTQGIIL